MLQKLRNQRGLALSKSKGFTIIEVLIVLAIAGLILLIVFLAVPALQRNSRNTQRNSDAGLVLSSVNECINNKNGQIDACSDLDAIDPDFLDTTKLRQLVNVDFSGSLPADTETVHIAIGSKCNTNGDAPEDGTDRQFAALFNVENTSGGNVPRCLES